MAGKHCVMHLRFSILFCCCTLSMLCQSQIPLGHGIVFVVLEAGPAEHFPSLFIKPGMFCLPISECFGSRSGSCLLRSLFTRFTLFLPLFLYLFIAVCGFRNFCWLIRSSACPSSTSFEEAVELLLNDVKIQKNSQWSMSADPPPPTRSLRLQDLVRKLASICPRSAPAWL